MENASMKFHNAYFLFLCCVCAAGISYQVSKDEPTHLPPVQPITFIPQPKENIQPPCHKDPKCSLLAEVVTYEARGEPLKGQVAVAHVVLNRKNDPRWPNKIVDVIKQPHQFSYLKDKHKQSPPTQDDWNRARKIAHDAINGLSQDPTNGAVFYHTKKVKPRLSTKRVIKTASIGQHVFFKTVE